MAKSTLKSDETTPACLSEIRIHPSENTPGNEDIQRLGEVQAQDTNNDKRKKVSESNVTTETTTPQGANNNVITTASAVAQTDVDVPNQRPVSLRKPSLVIFFGRRGSGKKAVAKGMFPDITQRGTSTIVTDSNDIIEMKSPSGDVAVLINLEPSLVGKHRRQTIMKYKGYFESLKAKVNVADELDAVTLIVFVFRRGCFTHEDRDMYEYILSCFSSVPPGSVKSRTALVITCCEDLSTEAQSKVVQNFETNRDTKTIAQFMVPHIVCVGFPDVKEVIGPLRDSYTQVIADSVKKLSDMLDSALSKPAVDPPVAIDKIFNLPSALLDNGKYYITKLFS